MSDFPQKVRGFAHHVTTLRENYPDALDFGVKYAAGMVALFSKDHGTTATYVVSNSMLHQRDPLNDFEAEIRKRHDSTDDDYREEIQGYVDTICLYIATCIATVNALPAVFMEEPLDQVVPFTELPDEVQNMCVIFVSHNADWALREYQDRDAVYDTDFMNKIVQVATSDVSSSRFYQRGARTARDTLALYVTAIVQCFPSSAKERRQGGLIGRLFRLTR